MPVQSGEPAGTFFRGVYAASATEIWAIGNNGLTPVILRGNGSTFAEVPSPVSNQTLLGVSGSGPGDIWIVGTGNTIMRWNGSSFSTVASGLLSSTSLNAVSVVSANEVWIGGNPTLDPLTGTTNITCVLRYNGTSVQVIRGFPQLTTILAVDQVGSGEVWLTGYDQTVKGMAIHMQNNAFGSYHDLGRLYAEFYGIAVRSSGELWMVGLNGNILHSTDGNTFSRIATSLPNTILYGVTRAGASDMTVVGSQRSIFHVSP